MNSRPIRTNLTASVPSSRAATKGIGQAVAARLREGGATVFTTARERPDDLPDPTLFMATDITTAEGCAAVATAVLTRLNGIDIIVH
jgi:NAD(P)-dependent dehydrogenase (short-subunit alcohol dehydrogenase family)